MRPEVTILTGPVHTGKSTALLDWLSRQRSEGKVVRGLLNPSVEGEKVFVDAFSSNTFPMEADKSEPSVTVGKYVFSEAAFERARQIISTQSLLPANIFVLDEIGKLELRGEGLEPAVSAFLSTMTAAVCPRVILVIRDFLVEEATARYGLQSAVIVEKAGLS